jgi:putative transposase
MKSNAHAQFDLKYHLVMVTKYRRKALNQAMLAHTREIFTAILLKWRCELLEFGGESDHVHVLFTAHPVLELSRLVNNLKTASSRRLRNTFPDRVKQFYWKPVFWHRAYYVSSVGDASLDTVKRYVASQKGSPN